MDPGEMSFLLALCSDNAGSGNFGWPPEILAHLKTSPERTVRQWTHSHIRTHCKEKPWGVSEQDCNNADEGSRNSPWISSSVMRSLAEKYFWSFTKLRTDLALVTASSSGELQGGICSDSQEEEGRYSISSSCPPCFRSTTFKLRFWQRRNLTPGKCNWSNSPLCLARGALNLVF